MQDNERRNILDWKTKMSSFVESYVIQRLNILILQSQVGMTLCLTLTQISLDSRDLCKLLSDYMLFAHAAYGFGAVYLEHGLVRVGKVGVGHLRNRQRTSIPSTIKIKGDNGANDKTIFLIEFFKQSRIGDSTSIRYVNWNNDVNEQPFFVAFDAKHNCLVISIRGTMGRFDVITDIKGHAKEIGHSVKGRAHMGMLECAEYIIGELEEHSLIQETESNSIVVTGHSLGAGVATLVSLILSKKLPQYNIKCYAFCPPGGLLCQRANEECQSIVTSVVVGKDMVPRLGLAQLGNLEKDIIGALRETQRHKWAIIFQSLISRLFKRRYIDLDFGSKSNLVETADGNGTRRCLHTTEPLNAQFAKSIRCDKSRFESLNLPGNIIHFLPYKSNGTDKV